MSKKRNSKYKKKGSRTERLVKEKFGMELEDFLRQKREKEFMTDSEIAELIGVHAGTIQKNREKYDIKFRLAGMRNKHRNDRICELMDSGDYTLQAVGDMFDLSRERVRQILIENEKAEKRLAILKKRRRAKGNGNNNGNGDGEL